LIQERDSATEHMSCVLPIRPHARQGKAEILNTLTLETFVQVVKKDHSRFSLFEALSHQRTTFSKYDLFLHIM